MSIRKFHKRVRKSAENLSAIARRNFNQNIDHYRKLHHPDRKRSASELETMRLAAERRPHGWAAKFLAGALARPDWAEDNANGEPAATASAPAKKTRKPRALKNAATAAGLAAATA